MEKVIEHISKKPCDILLTASTKLPFESSFRLEIEKLLSYRKYPWEKLKPLGDYLRSILENTFEEEPQSDFVYEERSIYYTPSGSVSVHVSPLVLDIIRNTEAHLSKAANEEPDVDEAVSWFQDAAWAVKTKEPCLNIAALMAARKHRLQINNIDIVLSNFVRAFFLGKSRKRSFIEIFFNSSSKFRDPMDFVVSINKHNLNAFEITDEVHDKIKAIIERQKKDREDAQLRKILRNATLSHLNPADLEEIRYRRKLFALEYPEDKTLFERITDDYKKNGTLPRAEHIALLIRPRTMPTWMDISASAKLHILYLAELAFTRRSAKPEEILEAAEFMYGLKRLGYCYHCAKEGFELVRQTQLIK
ncbi:MAG: hypothetical protein AB7F43_11480 [Bacteriovoracia bacterium]